MDAALASHPLRDRLVVFGGHDNLLFDDTWVWDGNEWAEQPRGPSEPPARRGAAMTYDSVEGLVLMFGGFDAGGQPLGDLWQWNGDQWNPRGPAQPVPSPRGGASMAFDRMRGVAVLHGGQTGWGVTDETWEWHGLTFEWRLLQPSAAPSPRERATMTFDETRAEVMLVGGVDDDSTWIWNGTRWAIIGGLDAPTEYRGGGLVYDRDRRRPVYFGGRLNDFPFGGVWELTAASGWAERNLAIVPPPREASAMAYDSTRGRVMVFGGNGPGTLTEATRYDDLWSYDGVLWTEWQ
jgi:hypothetical protein